MFYRGSRSRALLKLNSREATNDLLLVQNDLAALGLRTNDDRHAKDQTEVERLTAADPIILDDVGARYEILPMKQLRMKGAS